MLTLLKVLLKKITFLKEKNRLKKYNVIIENNVSFRNAKFSFNNRICKNSQINNTSMGSFSYIGWNSILNNVEIGSFCSIAPFVEVIYGKHPVNLVSTHPIFYSARKQCGVSFLKNNVFEEFNFAKNSKKSVVIQNDVWIGYGAKIIEGVTIGSGSVVLAGSIVTKDVDSYSIVGGIPAKHIRYRFDKQTIEKLISIKWWEKDVKWLKANVHKFLDVNQFLDLKR